MCKPAGTNVLVACLPHSASQQQAIVTACAIVSPDCCITSGVIRFDARCWIQEERRGRTRGRHKESAMSKQIISLRSVAVAAISASLSLSVLSVAQASPRADTAMYPKKHVARIHHPIRPIRRESELSRKIYDVAPNGPDCTWPYKRMLPPCMSTWPAGDPNYHGTLRGDQYE
jgi:hypothetical protein